MEETTKPKRRRFQFSLRTLLLAVLLLSLPLSWLATRMERARRQKEAVKAIQELGGSVIYNGNRLPGGIFPHGAPRVQTPWPSWLERVLGEDFFWDAERVYWYGSHPKVTDQRLVYLKDLKNVREVCLQGTQVTDAGLEYLKTFRGLEHLDLRGTQVTTEGVKKLREALPECYIVY